MSRDELEQKSAFFAAIWLVLLVVFLTPQGTRLLQRLTHPVVSRVFPAEAVSVSAHPIKDGELAIVRFTNEPYRRRAIINQGADHGVDEGAVVARDGTFVGLVQEVRARTAVIQLVSDPAFRVVGRIGQVDVIVTGQGMVARAERIPIQTDVSVGETVFTSVLDGTVPKGLALGTTTTIVSDGPLLKAAHVVPAVDPEDQLVNLEIIDE